MSLLDLYDSVFPISYIFNPPYNTAEEVAEVIQDSIDKAEATAKRQCNELQRADQKRP